MDWHRCAGAAPAAQLSGAVWRGSWPIREVNGSCLFDPSFSNVQEKSCIQSVCLQKQSCDGRDGSFWILPPRRLSPEGRGTEIAGTPPFMSPEAFVERDGAGAMIAVAVSFW